MMRAFRVTVALLMLTHHVLVGATQDDIHDVVDLDPKEILRRHPRIGEIMNRVQSHVVPVPLIIREYPDLWKELQDDEEVWSWFKKNMPHFTKERARVDKDVIQKVAPTKSKHQLDDLGSIIDRLLLSDEELTPEAAYVSLYVDFQNSKWAHKNYKRAKGMSGDVQSHEQRAWESHEIDRDYLGFFERNNIPKGARVLDIGTEMGLQAVAIAKLGYDVTGTDVGLAELLVASEYAKKEGVNVHFLQDDILVGESSFLTNHSYDVVIDRAVFHSMAPYLEEEPLIKESISQLFSERIKSLLKPNGVFIFKGMSADEESFRPDTASEEAQKEMSELNVIAVFRALQHVIQNMLKSPKKGLWANKKEISQGFGVDMDHWGNIIEFLDGIAKDELKIPNGIFVDLSKNPMPYHFRADEIPHYFKDIMGFDIIEMGKSHLYNDRNSIEMMPKAEFAVLKLHPEDVGAGVCLQNGEGQCSADPPADQHDVHKQVAALEAKIKSERKAASSQDDILKALENMSQKLEKSKKKKTGKGKEAKSWYESLLGW
ncbi:hypothetical protein TrCOL_g5646 [Triparma columacea]|jgi:2-polyprenyl-3-methyl-5-hydroxy-6-metoxy-1,4-benzoquinol methylase|uniref:Methyltransferase domain-containing protein n=1 Tax=Triparma columacea TaxID=722753 RepID=A0A9W7GK41_9STRA|nr:hypothetical protein TrCOL_g5646 [Triparma columacea]